MNTVMKTTKENNYLMARLKERIEHENGDTQYIRINDKISTTNLAACVCANLTNFCPYALISTPNVP